MLRPEVKHYVLILGINTYFLKVMIPGIKYPLAQEPGLQKLNSQQVKMQYLFQHKMKILGSQMEISGSVI